MLDDVKTMFEGAGREVPGAVVDMIYRIDLY